MKKIIKTKPSRNAHAGQMGIKTFKEADLKFKQIFDSASIGILIAEGSYRNFTDANQKICDMLGYSKEEILKLGVSHIHPEESLPYIFDQFDKMIKKEISEAHNLPFKRKDNSVFYADGSAANITLEGKECLVGMFTDITKRRKVEDALIKSEWMYRLLADNISEHVWIMDLNLKLTYISPSVEKLYGYTVDEIGKLSLKKIFTAESVQIIQDSLAKEYSHALTNPPPPPGTRRIMELQARHKDGHLLWIENSLSFIRDENGKPISIMGETRDITDRKKAQEKLREEEKRFRALAEQSSDIIILIDREGTIIYENPAVNKILGLNSDERTGKNFMENIHPDDVVLVTNAFNILISDKDALPQRDEIRLRHIDGSWRTFEVVGSNLTHNDFVQAIIINLRDITERKEADNLIRQSEEKYRLLADHMKDQIWLMDMSMKITYVSPSVERLTGYSSEEIKQMTWRNLLTPESLKKAVEFTSVELPKALKAPTNYLLFKTVELEFVLKSGRTVWGECEFSLIRDDTGKPFSILGEARNITERKLAEEKLQQTMESLKRATGATIQVLISALEVRDPYTTGHQSRAANLACAIAAEMGLDQNRIEGLNTAGAIHDIGKLSIPAEILTKPSRLTGLEFSLIKEHAQSGFDMLKDVESPWPLAQIVYQHHERMDGTGYPRNLKGEEIILEARILAVADVVEAMASHRPYRAALGLDAAISEIEKNKGTLYDSEVVDACLKLFREKNYKLEAHH